MIIAHILISILFFFILVVLSTTLLGLFVRSLFSNPELDRLKQDGHEFIMQEIKKSERANEWINVTALILIVAYFYLLFHFWNIGVVAAAVVLMAGRLPDLLWEIKHGKRVDIKLMKRDTLYYITSFLPWVALPILFLSLYYWQF